MREAADWYWIRQAGLRDEFIADVDRVVERIRSNPLQFPVVFQTDVRRARLKRFPYALYFRLANEKAYVLACFHGRRDPRRWRARA